MRAQSGIAPAPDTGLPNCHIAAMLRRALLSTLTHITALTQMRAAYLNS